MSAISGFCEKCNKFRKRHCDGNRNTCMTILFDKIEILQDENKVFKNCYDTAKTTIEALQQENEQLRAQVARMRELLAKAYDEIEAYKCLWKGSKPSGCDCPKPTALQDEIEQTLEEIDKAIGGKAHE